jgi:hypothetical protein
VCSYPRNFLFFCGSPPPPTVNWLRYLEFVFRRVSHKPLLANIRWQLLPEPSGKSCQKLLAVLAINLATERRRCYAAA